MDEQWYFKYAGSRQYKVVTDGNVAGFMRGQAQWEEMTREEYERANAPAPDERAAGDAASAFHWTLPSELVTPEVKTVLKRLQEMFDAKADENAQQLATLRQQLAAATARAERAEAALELIGQLDHDYRDGEGTVGINFTLSTVFKVAREALKAQADGKGE